MAGSDVGGDGGGDGNSDVAGGGSGCVGAGGVVLVLLAS